MLRAAESSRSAARPAAGQGCPEFPRPGAGGAGGAPTAWIMPRRPYASSRPRRKAEKKPISLVAAGMIGWSMTGQLAELTSAARRTRASR
jgi:hypothetical protein